LVPKLTMSSIMPSKRKAEKRFMVDEYFCDYRRAALNQIATQKDTNIFLYNGKIIMFLNEP